MGTIIYKKLFEVRILHEFYLSQPDETSIFNLSPEDRIQKLEKMLQRGLYDIRKDLVLRPTPSCEKILKNHRMKFLQTATGFLIGAEVFVLQNGAGPERYVLQVPLSGKAQTWTIGLGIKNPQFMNFTNIPAPFLVPARYLFSNDNSDSRRTFPSMSNEVPEFEAGRSYEMGTLIKIGAKLFQAQQKTNDPATGWIEIAQDNHWAAENDRILLPDRFMYTTSGPGIGSAEFILRSTSGDEIARIDSQDDTIRKQLDESGNLAGVEIDLTLAGTTGDGPGPVEPGNYQLEISESGGSGRQLPIHISNELYNGNLFGGVLINGSGGSDPAFRIIDEDGTLVRLPDGSHPVFEIRLKNRITYWRYRSTAGKKLEAKNKATGFLTAVDSGSQLVSKNSRSMQKVPLQFVDGGDKIFLPNPSSSRIIPEQDGRIYSDIFISEIRGLIENKN
jgi:hypothetical protein